MTISISEAIDLARYAMLLIMQISAPVLLVGMAVGLVISILQAVTQIQEQTLSFVPKMIAMAVITILVSSWATTRMLDFSQAMFTFQPFSG